MIDNDNLLTVNTGHTFDEITNYKGLVKSINDAKENQLK